ncbi:Kelch domain-containing protein 10 [Thelohanellus kitauei]|uniref:Kelch domain-containing protein 10 n=1 Tax=Thelohanellus kitauei TaxID=669202 RepID=A0A0C2I9Q9_THEKT|nr:Kelch domain-containing protein 10 [Thelohanellus kitauei]
MNVENVTSEPTGRTGHSMTSVNNFLIIYGGYDFVNRITYNELWMYNTIGDTWIRHQTPFDTENRSTLSAICAVGNFVYIFGGKNPSVPSQATNILISFDISSATWKILSVHTNEYDQNRPPQMYNSCIVYHNESLYIVGGFTEGEFSDKMFNFCLKTSKWTFVTQNAPKLSSKKKIFSTVFKNK